MIQIDMEIPKSCCECRFFVDYEQCEGKPSWCTAKNEPFEYYGGSFCIPKERPEWCPLKETKTPDDLLYALECVAGMDVQSLIKYLGPFEIDIKDHLSGLFIAIHSCDAKKIFEAVDMYRAEKDKKAEALYRGELADLMDRAGPALMKKLLKECGYE